MIYFSIRLKNSKKGIIHRTEELYLFCIETKDLSIIMFSPLAHFLINRPESLPLFSNAIFDGEQAFNDFIHNFDIGNFIDVDGNMYSTKTNEKTLSIRNYVLLGKALHTLPETHFRRASWKKVRPKKIVLSFVKIVWIIILFRMGCMESNKPSIAVGENIGFRNVFNYIGYEFPFK
ncbi:hypothetical protein [Bacillus sp. Cr_A10]|uniref:hypothetical protein n=1 Tax=Bacillus sp. Cr_A10 TaxID=3033993 RepID=UPI0023DB583B|nr:hypothetical protein [Bacillus sp. Cr_A10]MDF2066719.1 hypothetical protein [Bacillus sp. Cr_A10]